MVMMLPDVTLHSKAGIGKLLVAFHKRRTCSIYTAVLLGMSRGMCCSGGGPVDLLPSSLAVRGSILMSSPPAGTCMQLYGLCPGVE